MWYHSFCSNNRHCLITVLYMEATVREVSLFFFRFFETVEKCKYLASVSVGGFTEIQDISFKRPESVPQVNSYYIGNQTASCSSKTSANLPSGGPLSKNSILKFFGSNGSIYKTIATRPKPLIEFLDRGLLVVPSNFQPH